MRSKKEPLSTINNAPILETERLILRELTPEDFPDLHETFSDPQAMRFYPAPYTPEKTRELLDKILSAYQEHGHCLWAVIRKSDTIYLGDCGLIPQTVNGIYETEIGYHFRRRFWGNGYATEAAFGCKTYGFETLRKDKLISLIRPENSPSLAVAKRIGFRKLGETDIFGYHHWILGQLHNEYHRPA